MLNLVINILADAQPAAQNSNLESYKPFIYVVVVLVGLFLVIRTQRRVARNQSRKNLPARQQVAQHSGGEDLYGKINELMAGLADLSRQINGQIDTRLAKLQILMRQAEQTIAKLEQLTGKSAQPSLPPDVAEKEIQDICDDFHRHHLAGADLTPEAPKNSQETNLEKNKSPEKNNSPMVKSEPYNISKYSLLKQQTIDLAAQGYTAVEIAKELNRPVGEIELVLALQGKKDPPT